MRSYEIKIAPKGKGKLSNLEMKMNEAILLNCPLCRLPSRAFGTKCCFSTHILHLALYIP